LATGLVAARLEDVVDSIRSLRHLAVAGIRAAAASAASRTGVDLMARILRDVRSPFVVLANGLASSVRTIDDRVTIRSRRPATLPAMHASISTVRGIAR